MNYPLGALPSPQDYRDYHISRLIPLSSVHPDEYMHPFAPQAYNQGLVGACVAFSGVSTREAQERAERGKSVRFSPCFDYGYRTATQYQGEGMFTREYLENRLKVGSIPYEMLPLNRVYSIAKTLITQDMIDAAAQYRIAAYARVYTPDEVKSALRTLGPVLCVVPVYESFYRGGDLAKPDTSTEKLLGYHQVAIFGWQRDDRWRVLNSWGEEWGDNGWCTLPFDYPITEMWSVTDKIDARPDPSLPDVLYPHKTKVRVMVDGREVAFPDLPPMLADAVVGSQRMTRTLVPIRALEAAGLSVRWENQTVYIDRK